MSYLLKTAIFIVLALMIWAPSAVAGGIAIAGGETIRTGGKAVTTVIAIGRVMSGSQSLNSLITGGWGSPKPSLEDRITRLGAELEADRVLAEQVCHYSPKCPSEKDGGGRSSLREEELKGLIECGFSASAELKKLLDDTRSRGKVVPLSSAPHLRVDARSNLVAHDQPPPSSIPTNCGEVVKRVRAVLNDPNRNRHPVLSPRYGFHRAESPVIPLLHQIVAEYDSHRGLCDLVLKINGPPRNHTYHSAFAACLARKRQGER